MNTPENQTQRLFFACLPSEPLATALKGLAREHASPNARLVPRGNLHLTLTFLGSCTTEQKTGLVAQARELSFPAFELKFDRVRNWPGPRALVLSAASCPDPLLALVADLNGIARRQGIEIDARPYRPHITLARKQTAHCDQRLPQARCMKVNSLHLMRSSSIPGRGVHYESQWQFPAAG